jgi:hypothetical protein
MGDGGWTICPGASKMIPHVKDKFNSNCEKFATQTITKNRQGILLPVF